MGQETETLLYFFIYFPFKFTMDYIYFVTSMLREKNDRNLKLNTVEKEVFFPDISDFMTRGGWKHS